MTIGDEIDLSDIGWGDTGVFALWIRPLVAMLNTLEPDSEAME